MYAFPLKIKETTYKLFKFGKVVWAKRCLHFENVLFWAKTDINLQTKQNRHCSRGGEVGRRRRVIKFICNCINCSTVLQTKTIKLHPLLHPALIHQCPLCFVRILMSVFTQNKTFSKCGYVNVHSTCTNTIHFVCGLSDFQLKKEEKTN